MKNILQAAREEKRAERAEEKREERKLQEGARATAAASQLEKAPHSFVIHRGKVGKYVLRLVQDLRKVMEPYTASKLKASTHLFFVMFIVILLWQPCTAHPSILHTSVATK